LSRRRTGGDSACEHRKKPEQPVIVKDTEKKSDKVLKVIRYSCAVYCAYTIGIQVYDLNLVGAVFFTLAVMTLILPELKMLRRWIIR